MLAVSHDYQSRNISQPADYHPNSLPETFIAAASESDRLKETTLLQIFAGVSSG